MAKDTYTNIITNNKNSKISEYTNGLNKLKADIKQLNLTVNKTINSEIDRLIPIEEKKRFMDLDMTNEVELNRKIASLKPSNFFSIIGESADGFTYAKNYALKAMKPSDLEKPTSIDEATWKAKSLDQKKEEYYNYIKANAPSKLEEFVFKGMPESIKKAKITGDANIYFDMLSNDKKLELIARYGEMENAIEGKNTKFEDDLEKAQKRKDKLKAGIKNDANALINSMKDLIEENAKQIRKLQEEIIKQEEELKKIKEQQIDVAAFTEIYKRANPGVTLPDISELKKMATEERDNAIKRKKQDIKDLKADLETATAAQNAATIELNNAIKDIENTLAEKNIYVGAQSISEDTPTPSNNNSNVQNTSTGNTQIVDPKSSQSKRAGNMLKDMIGTRKDTGSIDVEDFKDMIHSHSYEEMVAMAKQLRGPLKKHDLRVFYDIAWEDINKQHQKQKLEQEINNTLTANGINIKIEDLKNIRKLDKDTIVKLEDVLKDYLNNYNNMPKKEQEALDALMDYVKIGILRRQTEHFKGLKDLFTRKNIRLHIGNFTRLLEKHSENYFNRENSVYSRVNSLREKIKLPPIDISKKVNNPKSLNKNKPTEHTL